MDHQTGFAARVIGLDGVCLPAATAYPTSRLDLLVTGLTCVGAADLGLPDNLRLIQPMA